VYLQLSERQSYLTRCEIVCVRVRWRENEGERESFRWVYRVRVRYARVCVTQGDGEFEREGEELRDGRVVRERITGKELGNLCSYDECTQDIYLGLENHT
jgi:hypothetical protein